MKESVGVSAGSQTVAGEANHLVVFAFVLLLTEVVVVKPIILICLCLIILGCTSNGVDYRNFAVDTYFPTPNEIQLAEARARNYWDRNSARFGPEPRYLAWRLQKCSGHLENQELIILALHLLQICLVYPLIAYGMLMRVLLSYKLLQN
jgi:hypothetical protein